MRILYWVYGFRSALAGELEECCKDLGVLDPMETGSRSELMEKLETAA